MIPIAISRRHIHLTDEDVEMLFGRKLSLRNPLKQIGQFAANETVSVHGPKGVFEKVRVVGPTRAYTQLEVSRTDAVFLGIHPPVSFGGHAKDPSIVTLVGPRGTVTRACAIIAARHLHASPHDAKQLGLKNGDLISVQTEKGTIRNILVRIDANFVTEIHLDADEGSVSSGELV